MTTEAEFKRLMAQAIDDPTLEPALLHALLDAPLYVHLPLYDESTALRLVCFTRPDGLKVIPFFSDADKAYRAAGAAARVACVSGRELFEAAPTATFMLDPNDTSMTLYPEETAALLSGLATTAPAVGHTGPVDVIPAGSEADRLAELLASALEPIAEAACAHVVRQAHTPTDRPALIAVIAVPDALAERAARALAMEIKRSGSPPDAVVDLTTYDPAGGPPEWLQGPEFDPRWVRSNAGDELPEW